MQVQRIDGMFRFGYIKSSDEIIIKMRTKVVGLKAKIEERKKRISDLRTEYKITNEIYIDLLEQARKAAKTNDNNRMSYSVSNTGSGAGGKNAMTEETFTIGAGVVNHLLTETDFYKGEEDQVERMELIIRNLRDIENDKGKQVGHDLSEGELTYLGF